MHKNSSEIIFKGLFEDLHLSGIWSDGKMISDAIPNKDPETIMAEYQNTKSNADFDLKVFFDNHFQAQDISSSNFVADTKHSVQEHIEKLWDVLSRHAFTPKKGSSALSLPYSYIVPGGRFNEIYYWDSYFTMLGLLESGRIEMIRGMINNFSYMIETYGFIPNGSRTYFLTRSQPPFFSLMIQLLAKIDGDKVFVDYHDALKSEYDFWMRQSSHDDSDSTMAYRAVKYKKSLLNRYNDSSSMPRAEMYGADVHLFKSSGREASSLYQNLRAACESGWDFSSRWLDYTLDLSSIHCTHIFPVDLNCLIYNLEQCLSHSYSLLGDDDNANYLKKASKERKKIIAELFWSDQDKFFMDFHFKDHHLCHVKSLAGVFPLFFNIASQAQAEEVAKIIESEFLHAGGVITTTVESGQQWDAPNGWAPLQYICIEGLRHYGFHDLATEIKNRWVDLNIKVYKNSGKLLEKYNVVDLDLLSGGGEYPVQDGFGWTNGVLLKLLNE